MSILDDVLLENRKFTEDFQGEKLHHHAQKEIVILTCMDCRLIDFFEPALGLERVDAKIIKNAGNTIVGEDAIRSIAVALYMLGAKEVMVVGHTECGMAGVDIEKLEKNMLDAGISKDAISHFDLEKWCGGFSDERENVLKTCEAIKNHPLIPDVPVHGLLLDIESGELEVLLDGY